MSFLPLLLIAAGAACSRIRIRSFTLGALGALFVGMLGGYFGIEVARPLMDFGMLLLIFVVGLQAGPKFIGTFRQDGLRIIGVAVSSLFGALGIGYLVKLWTGSSNDLFLGAVTGGFSSTSALAALHDIGESNASIVLGYSASYPIVTVLVLGLIPLAISRYRPSFNACEEAWLKKSPPPLVRRNFRITNQACEAIRIADLRALDPLPVTLSRIHRGEHALPVAADFVLHLGDVVVAVGEPDALDALLLLFGEEVQGDMQMDESIATIDTYVTSSHFAGKTLKTLNFRDAFGITITRIRRDGVEFLPKSDTTLEFGDLLVAIGDPERISRFNAAVNPDKARLDETHLMMLLLGIAFGVLIGQVPVSIGGSVPVRLGSSGGVFMVSMILGYFRGFGSLRMYLPAAAANILGELGTLLFVVGTGALAGKNLSMLFSGQGVFAIVMGSAIAVSVLLFTYCMARLLKFDAYESIGIMCGILTMSTALPRSGTQLMRQVSALYYASLYPIALITQVVMVQVLAYITP